MRITAPGTVATGSVKRRRQTSSSDAKFSVETESASRAGEAGKTSPTGSVGGLLSLQEVGNDLDERSKSLKRGHDILDRLDELRHALLAGAVPRAKLQTLLALVNQQRAGGVDGALEQVLAEIELRARVELAKYEQNETP